MSLLLKGVTKLSELDIDANKDWQGKGISNIGTVVVTDGAGHYFELPSLTTAQRDALTPSTGMTIWNSDNTRLERYNGAAWGAIGVAAIAIRKDSGSVIGTRPQINIHTGVGMGLLVEDNPADNEVDITYSSAAPYKNIILLPEDAVLPTVNPPARVDTDGNFSYQTLDFDHTTEETCFWERWLSQDYNEENIVADIYWKSPAAAGNAKFGFSVLGRAEGETWDVAMGIEQTVVGPTGGAGVLNRARITTFAPGWNKEDTLLFKLARKAADGADTIDADDVEVVKVVVSYTMTFKQSFYALGTPVELDIGAIGAWREIDVSAYIPEGATGVILHPVFATAGANAFGLRKKGSTDNRIQQAALQQFGAMIGVDNDRKFECYHGDPNLTLYLVGYTGPGVTFFDNAYNKSIADIDVNAWKDVDCSVECPNAIGIIIEVILASGGARRYGLRKKGSSDDRHEGLIDEHNWAVVGCDGSQVFQGYINLNTVDFYVVGYITEGASFKTNATDKSLGVTEAWTDIDCQAVAPNANFLFFECYNPSVPSTIAYKQAIRKNTSSEDFYDEGDYNYHVWQFVRCDANQVVEGKIENTKVDFFLYGYATHAG